MKKMCQSIHFVLAPISSYVLAPIILAPIDHLISCHNNHLWIIWLESFA